jgi:DNA primase
MKYDADRIKELNPLSRELDRYGIEADRKGFARCPFHTEKTASFRVYPDGTFHCFGCHAYGDVITFVMKMESLDFQEACARLDRDITYSEQRKIERVRRQRESRQTAREQAEAEYFVAFDNWKQNEDKLKLFEPAAPGEEPNKLFLYYLGCREQLSYLLDCAEINLYKAVNQIGL